MSRITNDAETIQQAISFALVNVFSGILLLFWIGYNMIHLSPALGLLSLAVVPVMAVATVWFSSQARKAFRKTRREMGSVNAELQESIAAVREVQAFNRAEENIENFRNTNAANRDANIRAVAFTSALAPTLEALGYLALAIVTCFGGLALLGNATLLGATVSIGLIITFLGYVQRFNQPIQQIAVLWTNPAKSMQAIQKREKGTLTDKDIERINAAKNKFAKLYPMRENYKDWYDNPQSKNIAEGWQITELADLPDEGECIVLGKLTEKDLRDENETVRLARRGGVLRKGQSKFVDFRVVDDSTTKSIIIRIPTGLYNEYGESLVEKSIENVDVFLIRGKRIRNYPMIKAQKILCLTNKEMFE